VIPACQPTSSYSRHSS